MQQANLPENLERLGPRDELKFVLADRRDFDWALAARRGERISTGATRDVLAGLGGPAPPRSSRDWIRDSGRSVRLGLQLHKILWGDVPGR